jgi:hypothetical protein
VGNDRRYVCLPTLDGTAPDAAALDELLRHAREETGPIYIHCAQGRGRSAALAAALLIARGAAANVDEAEATLRRARPSVRLNPAQRAWVARAIRATAVTVALLITACLVASCTAHQYSTALQARDADGELEFEPAPITGYPLIRTRVNGHPARFAFDTGGGRAIIVSPSFVKSAGLAVERSAESRVNGRAYPSARIRSLNVDNLGQILHDESAAVVSLEAFSEVCGERVDGIVGAVAFAKRSGGSFEIDFPRRRLCFGNCKAGSSDVPASIPAAPDPQRQGRPFVWLQFGKTRVPAIIDSCEYEAVQVPEPLLAASRISLNDSRPSVGSGGFSGEVHSSRRGRIPEIRLGDVVIRDAQVQLVPGSGGAAEKAVIGTAVLRHYRLAFDARAATVILFGPRELVSPAPDRRAVETAEGILAR